MTDHLQLLRQNLREYTPTHFRWSLEHDGGVAVITLNRPERKNPLTFNSYVELRDCFRALASDRTIRAVIITGEGGNFCSGGDVFEIIGPLTEMNTPDLLAFTRLTGDLVKAMRACPQPVITAADGVAAGAGAILAMASDLRIATPETTTSFLFARVGLAGCDMGACALLPRIIGQGRASELLYFGRAMHAAEGEQWGFWNKVVDRSALLDEALAWAARIAKGPGFAHGMTKMMLSQEWNVSIDQALEMEAQAQALCMQTEDFRRAYNAFREKRTPEFQGD
ncbi:MAG: enoyl-CoA hydratase family protein [Phycisphaerae bacterium]|nr:enoyl-CoA hydratase family protein [Gemmatimonadaceae bacterium]